MEMDKMVVAIDIIEEKARLDLQMLAEAHQKIMEALENTEMDMSYCHDDEENIAPSNKIIESVVQNGESVSSSPMISKETATLVDKIADGFSYLAGKFGTPSVAEITDERHFQKDCERIDEGIDLSTPEGCRLPLEQIPKVEESYFKLANVWSSDEAYHSSYMKNSKIIPSAGYDGFVSRTFSKLDFDRCVQFVEDETRSMLNDENEEEDYFEIEHYPIIRSRKKFPPSLENPYITSDYVIFSPAGSGAFSNTFACNYNGSNREFPELVCMKMIDIRGNEDTGDMFLNEIQILRDLRDNADENHIVKIFDYFQYDNYLCCTLELLQDNLYEVLRGFAGSTRKYFNVSNLRIITRQILEALVYIHSLGIIHADIKPENILLLDPTHINTPPRIKLIDFGSCKLEKNRGADFYIQSRPYRAVEIILGCGFNSKIDVWSLGCMIGELFTENLFFENKSIPIMLAQIIGACGAVPRWMIQKGSQSSNYFRDEYLYERIAAFTDTEDRNFTPISGQNIEEDNSSIISVYFPKPTSIANRLCLAEDDMMVDFLRKLLQIDPNNRVSASEALTHSWLS